MIHTAPGVSMTMMTLDPTRGQMIPYGTGVVSANGTQIVPDLDPAFPGKRYGIVNFDWHGPMPPPSGAGGSSGGGGCCERGNHALLRLGACVREPEGVVQEVVQAQAHY